MLYYVCLVLFVMVACGMLALILLQKSRGATQALFGGSSGHSLLGSRTPAALTWMTAGSFALFLALAVALNLLA